MKSVDAGCCAVDRGELGQRTGAQMWARVRSKSFRIRLQLATVFTNTNDAKNEKEAKVPPPAARLR